MNSLLIGVGQWMKHWRRIVEWASENLQSGKFVYVRNSSATASGLAGLKKNYSSLSQALSFIQCNTPGPYLQECKLYAS